MSETPPESQIYVSSGDKPSSVVKADPRVRRKAILVIVVVTLVALPLIPFVESQLEDIKQVEEPPLSDLVTLSYLVFIGFTLSTAAVGFVVLRIGLRIFREGEYPWPGMWVIKDTRLRTGSQAQRLAWAYSVCGTVVILASFGVLWFSMRFLEFAFDPLWY